MHFPSPVWFRNCVEQCHALAVGAPRLKPRPDSASPVPLSQSNCTKENSAKLTILLSLFDFGRKRNCPAKSGCLRDAPARDKQKNDISAEQLFRKQTQWDHSALSCTASHHGCLVKKLLQCAFFGVLLGKKNLFFCSILHVDELMLLSTPMRSALESNLSLWHV